MSGWIHEYVKAAHRTRWISLIGAAVMLFAVAGELARIYINVSIGEAPLRGDFADFVIAVAVQLVAVGVSFAIRGIFLIAMGPDKYRWISLSWLLSFFTVVFYLWPFDPHSGPDLVALAGLGFLFFSFWRSLITAAVAGSRFRYR